MRHVNEPPPSVLDRRPDCPLRLDLAIQRAMAKDPEERFGSMDEFCAELEACLAELDGRGDEGATMIVPPQPKPRRAERPLDGHGLFIGLLHPPPRSRRLRPLRHRRRARRGRESGNRSKPRDVLGQRALRQLHEGGRRPCPQGPRFHVALETDREQRRNELRRPDQGWRLTHRPVHGSHRSLPARWIVQGLRGRHARQEVPLLHGVVEASLRRGPGPGQRGHRQRLTRSEPGTVPCEPTYEGLSLVMVRT